MSVAERQPSSFRGQVVRETFAPGSKSEHNSVSLKAGAKVYRLRRQGGNPFSDPVLDSLVGKHVRATGFVTGPDLIMSDWEEVGADEPG